ncbi:MAG: hypothetical protein ABSG13_19505 [Bryobacteraceae bacterium]|jgi:hypothetical protein
MSQVNAFSKWLTHISLQGTVDHYVWIVPLCQSLHFIGLALLMAGIGLFDLRRLVVSSGGRDVLAPHASVYWQFVLIEAVRV